MATSLVTFVLIGTGLNWLYFGSLSRSWIWAVVIPSRTARRATTSGCDLAVSRLSVMAWVTESSTSTRP